MRRPSQFSGFTLIELMLGIVVLAILLAVAVPSFNNLSEKYRLKGAAERLSADTQMAKSTAIARNEPITISIRGGTDWCVGVTEGTSGCDCDGNDEDNVCEVDDQERVFSAEDFEGVIMGDGDEDITFKGVRGLPMDSISNQVPFNFSNDFKKQVDVNVTRVGSVWLCSPAEKHLGGYEEC